MTADVPKKQEMAINIRSTQSINTLKCNLYAHEQSNLQDKMYGVLCKASEKALRLLNIRLSSIYLWVINSGCELDHKTVCRIQDFIESIDPEIFNCAALSSNDCFGTETISCNLITVTEIPTAACTNNLTLTTLI